ncbi:MAG: hypothetical protein ACK56F_11350, partial [bacterium]
ISSIEVPSAAATSRNVFCRAPSKVNSSKKCISTRGPVTVGSIARSIAPLEMERSPIPARKTSCRSIATGFSCIRRRSCWASGREIVNEGFGVQRGIAQPTPRNDQAPAMTSPAA